jgi:hypothetical protein
MTKNFFSLSLRRGTEGEMTKNFFSLSLRRGAGER